eukprot:SAG22_NODE_9288_length_598_cov_2.058116_1_plen_165_part_01
MVVHDPDPSDATAAATGAPAAGGLASLPPNSVITLHKQTLAVLRKALVDDHGMDPVEERRLKNQQQVHDKCRQVIEAAGHAMITSADARAIPFTGITAATRSRHYADWRKDDIYIPPEAFVGRLGPKQRLVVLRRLQPDRPARQGDLPLPAVPRSEPARGKDPAT